MWLKILTLSTWWCTGLVAVVPDWVHHPRYFPWNVLPAIASLQKKVRLTSKSSHSHQDLSWSLVITQDLYQCVHQHTVTNRFTLARLMQPAACTVHGHCIMICGTHVLCCGGACVMCCYALLLLLTVRTNFSEFSMLNQSFLNLLN